MILTSNDNNVRYNRAVFTVVFLSSHANIDEKNPYISFQKINIQNTNTTITTTPKIAMKLGSISNKKANLFTTINPINITKQNDMIPFKIQTTFPDPLTVSFSIVHYSPLQKHKIILSDN